MTDSTDGISKPIEKELEVLEQIYTCGRDIHQRDLAEIVGMSLGMTNAILKRLVQKGFLQIRKINNRNIRYVVSPQGVEAITRKSYRYFKRTVRNVVYYRRLVENLVSTAKADGFDGIMLIGASDLDFIVEHACGMFDIDYVRNPEEYQGLLFLLFSETYIPDDETRREYEPGAIEFLQSVLMLTDGNRAVL